MQCNLNATPLHPHHQVIELAMNDAKDKLFPMLDKLNVLSKLKTEDKELSGKPLMKRIMQTWLPASEALLEMIIYHLPSPAKVRDTAAVGGLLVLGSHGTVRNGWSVLVGG